ncbi:MAG: hypothetical protein IKM30_05465 [Oscillospiraceae bacterium]|nr:hypothetical protein [Oscillospiraceae bacterium]
MNGLDERNGTPLLEEPSYTPTPKRSGPAPVDAASLLSDMGAEDAKPAQQTPRYQQLSEEQIAILQQQRADNGQPPYTQEEIAELKAEFIERQRLQFQQQAFSQQQQAAQSSVVLEEATYTAPAKKTTEALPQVDASQLLEEAAPEPERRVSFDQADLEAAKKAAAKRAVESLKEAPPPKDPAESRRQMEALRQQQLADLAQAGFPVSIILTILGVIAGACMALFASRPFPEGTELSGFLNVAGNIYRIAGIGMALLAITIVLRIQPLKGFTSFLFGAASVLLLIPGSILLFQHRGGEGFALTCTFFLIALVLGFAVTFTLSTSDKLNAYYGKKEIMYD